jgi:hypothetical protein
LRLLGGVGVACHIPGMTDDQNSPDLNPPKASKVPEASQKETPVKPREIGGPKGLEPTRYGDWEVGGRCTDF